MYVIIGFPNGEAREAIVMAAAHDRMRVALRDADDAVELRKTRGGWKAEDGRAVELESVLYDAGLCRVLLSSSYSHAPFRAA